MSTFVIALHGYSCAKNTKIKKFGKASILILMSVNGFQAQSFTVNNGQAVTTEQTLAGDVDTAMIEDGRTMDVVEDGNQATSE